MAMISFDSTIITTQLFLLSNYKDSDNIYYFYFNIALANILWVW